MIPQGRSVHFASELIAVYINLASTNLFLYVWQVLALANAIVILYMQPARSIFQELDKQYNYASLLFNSK